MAGRRASVRYYPSRGAYYTTYHGKTHRLAEGPDDAPSGPAYLAALETFKRLMQQAAAPTAQDENTLRTIVDRYLDWLPSRRKPATVAFRQWHLHAFCAFSDQGGPPYGELRIRELTPHHVERYCDYMRKPRWDAHHKKTTRWTGGMVRCMMASLQVALNWAAGPKQRLITANPIRGMEMPAPRSRGAHYLVPPEIHAKALAAAKPDLRQLLVMCENTGCRPGELFMAEARHFDPQLGALVFRGRAHLAEEEKGHKTSSKDKDRVIILTGEALDLVRQLAAKYPTGPLFRTVRGQGGKGGQLWDSDATYQRMRRLRKQVGLPGTYTLYSYRHQYATAWLKAGGSIDDLAALLGNTPEIIRRHYSHLCDDRERLRQLAAAFREKIAVGGNGSPDPARLAFAH